MVIKETRSDKIFNFINYFLLACVFLICLYPLWFIIIASISNPDLVNGGQVWFWPKDISFDGYKSLFADDGVMRGYVNTLIYTTGGTLINLAVTLPAAYALSRRDFVGRCCFSKRMRKLFRKNEKSVLRFCNKSSKTKRAFTKVLMPCKRPF